MGAFDHVAGAIRRPPPGSVASVGSVVEDLVRGVRQVQRQIGNGRRLTEQRTGSFYAANFTSGANAGTSYLFDPLTTLDYARWSVSITVEASVTSGGTWDDYLSLSLAVDVADSFYSSSIGGSVGGSSNNADDTIHFECLGGPIGLLCGVRPSTPAGTLPASPVSTFLGTMTANRHS